MTDWAVVWLGTMAVALVVMSLVQVGVGIVAIMAARRAAIAAEDVRRDLKPLIDKANRIAEDAARASAIAAAQVERLDEMLTDTTTRINDTVRIIQDFIVGPVRQGTAIVAAVKAALSFFRDRQRSDHRAPDDDDALFIG